MKLAKYYNKLPWTIPAVQFRCDAAAWGLFNRYQKGGCSQVVCIFHIVRVVFQLFNCSCYILDSQNRFGGWKVPCILQNIEYIHTLRTFFFYYEIDSRNPCVVGVLQTLKKDLWVTQFLILRRDRTDDTSSPVDLTIPLGYQCSQLLKEFYNWNKETAIFTKN